MDETGSSLDLTRGIPPRTLGQADDPIVHARLFIPGSNRTWFITGGERRGDEFVFFGFEHSCHHSAHAHAGIEELPLSFLHRAAHLVGSRLERDQMFSPRPLSHIDLGE